MLDSDNVLIRCPNGHELQTAKADMQKKLACPICNTVFTPADVHASPDAPAGTTTDPHVLDLAAGQLGQPVTYPAYTKWMLAAWIILTVVQVYGAVQQQVNPTQHDAQLQTSAATLGRAGLGCLVVVVVVAAVVMQLMWIYRIHTDARRAGQYDGASPGLALGLSFIPAFNYIWTAYLMRRLARFAASADTPEGASEEPAETLATRAATVNLLLSIPLGCSCLATTVLIGIGQYKVLQLMLSQTGQPPSPELKQQAAEMVQVPFAWTVVSLAISVVAVCVYAWSVRRMEKSLYPRLGAIEP